MSMQGRCSRRVEQRFRIRLLRYSATTMIA
jgi:hypothetical protein